MQLFCISQRWRLKRVRGCSWGKRAWWCMSEMSKRERGSKSPRRRPASWLAKKRSFLRWKHMIRRHVWYRSGWNASRQKPEPLWLSSLQFRETDVPISERNMSTIGLHFFGINRVFWWVPRGCPAGSHPAFLQVWTAQSWLVLSCLPGRSGSTTNWFRRNPGFARRMACYSL